jgi:hypothetical protein
LKKYIAHKIVQQQARSSSKLRKEFSVPTGNPHIGIVFDGSSPENRKQMEIFREKLQRLGADVKALGFINEKKFPQGLLFKPGFDFFTKKDLLWNGLAKSTLLDNFNRTATDYFIGAFTRPEPLFMQFAAKSNATFRIGPYFEEGINCFDFMLELKEKKELAYFCELCEHYIKQLTK